MASNGTSVGSSALAGGTLAVLSFVLVACGAARAQVRGIAPVNVNDSNESAPVNVRFYQLADDERFQRSTFESLWLDDAKALGKDLLAKPVVATVFPGSRDDEPMRVQLGKLKRATAFIGVMALYRKADPTEPRILIVPAARISDGVIVLSGYGVAIESVASETERSATPGAARPATPRAADTEPARCKAGR